MAWPKGVPRKKTATVQESATPKRRGRPPKAKIAEAEIDYVPSPMFIVSFPCNKLEKALIALQQIGIADFRVQLT